MPFVLTSGGAPTVIEGAPTLRCMVQLVEAEAVRRFPGGLIEIYGMTEGGGRTELHAHQYPDKLHTVGQPAEGHDVRLIDEQGQEVPRGEAKGSTGWEQRWAMAGGELIDGRMIARKDDPVWRKLGDPELFADGIGNEWPPYAFNSGMRVKDIDLDRLMLTIRDGKGGKERVERDEELLLGRHRNMLQDDDGGCLGVVALAGFQPDRTNAVWPCAAFGEIGRAHV